MEKSIHPSPALSGRRLHRHVAQLPATDTPAQNASIVDGSLRRGDLAASTPEHSAGNNPAETSEVSFAMGHSERMQAYVSHIVATAPPLTPEQISHVSFLLRPEIENPEQLKGMQQPRC